MNRFRISSVLASAFLMLAALSLTVAHADDTWEGDVSNDLKTGGNWVDGSAPGSGERAIFNDTGTSFTPSLGSNWTINSIEFGGATASYTFATGVQVLYLTSPTQALISTSSQDQVFNSTGGNLRASGSGNGVFTNNGTGLITVNNRVMKENSGNLVFNGTGDFSLDFVVKRYGSLTTGLVKGGSGTVTIQDEYSTFDTSGSNVSGLTNEVTIQDAGGVLRIEKPLAAGTGDFTLLKDGADSGTLELALTGTNTISNTFTGFNSSTSLSGGGTANILNTSGTNKITSNLTVTGTGGNGMNFVSNGGLLELAGTLTTTVDNNRKLSLGGSGAGLVSGAITGSGTLAFGVEKVGDGTWTFTGANTYGGSTNIADGTLLINSAHTGGGAYTVASGATLGGTGSTESSVTVNGTFAPGASIESLATGALSFAAGSTFAYDLNSSSLNGDLAIVDGNLSITGSPNLSFTQEASGTLALGSKLTLINYSGTWDSGTFNGYANGATFTLGANQWQINYADTTGGTNFSGEQSYANFVTMTVVPEPGTLAMLAFGALAMYLFRRR